MSEGQSATAFKSGAPDPLIGRVIADRFKITSLIARGGMGKVYRAEQAPLGRLCAIKVLNPSYNGDADPEFHRRFFREASITSKITHPNCITLFDYGKTDDDIYYMAMEYLEGQTLHAALREVGVMHELRAGKIASQICRALREAHSLGVIHRDLKPANIFLTRPSAPISGGPGSPLPGSEEDEDFVKVLDFGLVKHLSERPEEQLTQTGLFMGSPKYMAPEQIQGAHVDARTDIYALGIIMYEMLAGKVPFERATSVNILMAHVGEAPPPMRAVNPNLVCSPAFEELVMRCIAKEQSQRFETMDHLLAAIRRAHGGAFTGQLPTVNMSGPYALASSAPPPVVSGVHGLRLPPAPPPPGSGPTIVSAPPAGVEPGGLLAELGSGPIEPATRSKLWIALGVVIAAAVGGGLGMLAFHWTTPPVPVERAPSGSASASSAEAVAAATDSPAPAPPKTVTVRVTSEPPGAVVREGGEAVCAATPCDVVYEGAAADEPHELVVSRAGFRTEARTIRTSDGPVHVRLARATGGPARPAPAPAPVSAPTPKPEPTTPSGFKDLPY